MRQNTPDLLNPNSRARRILNSWKEISVLLDRGVRTLQRWEREYQTPVYRICIGTRSAVFAIPSELYAWILEMGAKNLDRAWARKNCLS